MQKTTHSKTGITCSRKGRISRKCHRKLLILLIHGKRGEVKLSRGWYNSRINVPTIPKHFLFNWKLIIKHDINMIDSS